MSVTVHALDGGHLTVPDKVFIAPADPDAKCYIPSLCFLIQHTDASTSKLTRIVFDLGLRRDTTLYPTNLQTHIKSRQPMSTMPDVVASLARGGLTPADIDTVILSHVHYDHVGYPKDFGPPTQFIIGPGASDLLAGRTALNIGSHSFFEADLVPSDRTTELQSPSSNAWQPIEPFSETIDHFGDGSVFIINAPGHLPGHINALVRTTPPNSPQPKFVYLAGDACHDIRLFTGEKDIATWTDEKGNYCCIHADVAATKETLRRMKVAMEEGVEVEVEGRKVSGEVEVVFAHNGVWEQEAREGGRFWPGKM